MQWFKSITTVSTLLLASLSWSEIGPWELQDQNDEKDIQVFTRTVGDSPLKEFKGVTHIKADTNAFVSLLMDSEAATSWMHNVVEFNVEDSPSQTENVVYTVNKTPWPVTNRDAYIRSELSADANGVVTSTLTGMSDFKADNDDYIRMPELKGSWVVAPMEGGMIEVTYQVHANPGGSLPDWLVNAIVVETPMNTLQNLHDVIHSEKYQGKTYAFIEQAKAPAAMAVKPVISEVVAVETMTAE
jgi:hypothetical protein